MMYIPGNAVGYFIRYPFPARLVVKPGRIRRHICMLAGQTPGQGLVWMKKKGFYLLPLGLPAMISMEAAALEMVYMPTVCWLWMPGPGNGYGISKRCIMIFGTGIFLP